MGFSTVLFLCLAAAAGASAAPRSEKILEEAQHKNKGWAGRIARALDYQAFAHTVLLPGKR